MKIYVAHSTAFDFVHDLYEPLRESQLNSEHQILLPHENSSQLFDSKKYLTECDLVIAEVTYPSTGMGIELGWANANGVRIVAIYRSDAEPSHSLQAVTTEMYRYSPETLIDTLTEVLEG